MHDLTQMTALGGSDPRIDTIGTLTLTERIDVALASVAARAGGAAKTTAAVKKHIGVDAPGPGKWAGAKDVTVLWIGPEQWLICAPFATHELIADDLEKTAGQHASVTEQTGGWVQFDVTGDALADLMERTCALPIRSMSKGDANRTRIEMIACFVVVTAQGVSILGPSSSAASLHHALVTAMRAIA